MATTIMIVRHGEKPSDDDSIRGVSETGAHDADELSVRGWQRAGALVRFFAPSNGGFPHPDIATPDVIFAAAGAPSGKSLRSEHTVLPLAKFLRKEIDLRYTKGQELALAHEVLKTDGAVLIAWEHKLVPDIVNRIVGEDNLCPQKWPDSRFDLVWIVSRSPHSSGWKFTQAPQMVLAGDSLHTV